MNSVTVLMSVKNGEKYIAEAVQSILSQTYADFDFLIIDNDSSDSTVEIIESFRDLRIRVIKMENDIGQTKALNFGLSKVETPYVARIDADDISYPNRLEVQLGYLLKNPEVALVGCFADYVDEKGCYIFSKKFQVEHKDILRHSVFGNQFNHTCIVARTDAVREVGCYNESFYLFQDYQLWLKLISKFPSYNIPEVLAKIRVHGDQTSRQDKHREIFEKEIFEIIEQIGLKLDLDKKAGDALALRRQILQSQFKREYLKLAGSLLKLGVSSFSNQIYRSFLLEQTGRLVSRARYSLSRAT